MGLLSDCMLLDVKMALWTAVLIADMINSAYVSRSLVDVSPEKSLGPGAASSVDSNASLSGSQATNCRSLMDSMQTAGLTNLSLALPFILTIVLTSQKNSELLFTLTLVSYCRRKKTLFKKQNTQH